MERDFEQEFRELKRNETPDLWNRIEAALPEKKLTAVSLEENKTIPIEQYIPKKGMSWRNWGLIIAACLCVLILLPVVFLRVADFSEGAASDSAATGSESGAAQWGDAAAAGEAEASEDMANAATEAAESAADAGMKEDVSAAAAETENGDDEVAAEATEADGAESEGAGGQIMSEWEDGQIVEDVVVEILRVDLSGKEIFYEAFVIEGDARQFLDAGMEVRIFCNDESVYDFPLEPRAQAVFQTGGRYTVTLCYQEAYGQGSGEEAEAEGEWLTFLVVEAL